MSFILSFYHILGPDVSDPGVPSAAAVSQVLRGLHLPRASTPYLERRGHGARRLIQQSSVQGKSRHIWKCKCSSDLDVEMNVPGTSWSWEFLWACLGWGLMVLVSTSSQERPRAGLHLLTVVLHEGATQPSRGGFVVLGGTRGSRVPPGGVALLHFMGVFMNLGPARSSGLSPNVDQSTVMQMRLKQHFFESRFW